jgi:hypothetical protein
MTITKKVTRGVKISSGLVLLGVVAGTFLGNWLPKFDGGDGVIPVQGSKPDLNEKEPPPAEADPQTTPANPRSDLQITIKDRGYWIAAEADGTLQEITLEQVVELATATTGDENGIRVRVIRAPSARARAEENLEQALLDAKIPRDSIVGLGPTLP